MVDALKIQQPVMNFGINARSVIVTTGEVECIITE